MTDDSLLPFDLPAVYRKKVTAAQPRALAESQPEYDDGEPDPAADPP